MSFFDKMFKPRESNESTMVDQGFLDLRDELKDQNIDVKKYLILNIIASFYLSGIMVHLMQRALGVEDEINAVVSLFISPVYAITTGMGWVLTFFIFVVFTAGEYKFIRKNIKPYYRDEFSGNNISKKGELGDSHWLTEKERDELFDRSQDIEDITGNILGIDKKGYLHSLKNSVVGLNKNKLIIGPPGSGKSAYIVENDIIQACRRGESIVITDSKGDVYKDTFLKVKEFGYKIRVLNVKPGELRHSDAFNICKYLNDPNPDSDMVSNAGVLADSIVFNTGDGKYGYWPDNERNLYQALLMYVATNEEYIRTGKNNLVEVFRLSKKKPKDLALIFNGLADEHPAKQAFEIFANAEERNQGQILNGAAMRLNFMINNSIKEIVSNDEIDLVEPMKRKCAYYVIIPDQASTYNVIANLFFNMMLMKQSEYSDSLPEDYKEENQLTVNYILDEFRATGSISNFQNIINTVRSRKMSFTIILQAKEQLQSMYPDDFQSITTGFSLKLLLLAGDEDTAKWFSDMCGNTTVYVQQKRYSENSSEIIKSREEKTANDSIQRTPLLPVEKAMGLHPDEVVIVVSNNYHCVRLHKFLKKDNPYLQHVEKKMPTSRRPAWRKKLEEERGRENSNVDAESKETENKVSTPESKRKLKRKRE